MNFPSLAFVEALQAQLNASPEFATATRWSDVKIVLAFGSEQYWLKLYGGRIIDLMPWFPMANPLGWDYRIAATLAHWQALRAGTRAAGHLLDTGDISIDGNLLQANRLYESTHLIVAAIRDLAAD